MNKWIAIIIASGAVLAFSTNSRVNSTSSSPAASSPNNPCPHCCPPEICGTNGRSLDGTSEPGVCDD